MAVQTCGNNNVFAIAVVTHALSFIKSIFSLLTCWIHIRTFALQYVLYVFICCNDENETWSLFSQHGVAIILFRLAPV